MLGEAQMPPEEECTPGFMRPAGRYRRSAPLDLLVRAGGLMGGWAGLFCHHLQVALLWVPALCTPRRHAHPGESLLLHHFGGRAESSGAGSSADVAGGLAEAANSGAGGERGGGGQGGGGLLAVSAKSTPPPPVARRPCRGWLACRRAGCRGPRCRRMRQGGGGGG